MKKTIENYNNWEILRVSSESDSARGIWRVGENVEGKKGYFAYYESITGNYSESYFIEEKTLGKLKDIHKIPNMKPYIRSYIITDGNIIKEFKLDRETQEFIEIKNK